jgi:hypothetical protein
MGLSKDSEDALAITKWKLPGVVFGTLEVSDLCRQKQRATLAAGASVGFLLLSLTLRRYSKGTCL